MKVGNLVGKVSYYFPLIEDYYEQRPGLILEVRPATDYTVKPPAKFNYYKVLWQDDGFPTYVLGSHVEEHEAEELEPYINILDKKKKEWYDKK